MPSYPPVQSVVRTLGLLKELNQRSVTTVDQLYRATGLPKPTIVRLLETLIHEGFVATDKRLGGYCVTSTVQMLSAGFHGTPLVVEAGRGWCIDLTRRLKWPVAMAMLDGVSASVRFSTIPDSPISPFHATLSSRVSLLSRALGRAYLGFCAAEERTILIRLLKASHDPEDQSPNVEKAVRDLTRRMRRLGYAERDPNVGPKAANTVAVPIFYDDRVLATLGMSYFRSAVPPHDTRRVLVPALQDTAHHIEQSVRTLLKAGHEDNLPAAADKAPSFHDVKSSG
jgi:IclR family mhp operon transcriptional activator